MESNKEIEIFKYDQYKDYKVFLNVLSKVNVQVRFYIHGLYRWY